MSTLDTSFSGLSCEELITLLITSPYFPTDSPEERAEDPIVDHGDIIESYLLAQGIASPVAIQDNNNDEEVIQPEFPSQTTSTPSAANEIGNNDEVQPVPPQLTTTIPSSSNASVSNSISVPVIATPTPPFACPHCNLEHSNRTTLRRHLDVHGTRKWTCPTCPKTYKRKTDLQRHARIHHGPKKGAEKSD